MPRRKVHHHKVKHHKVKKHHSHTAKREHLITGMKLGGSHKPRL